MKIYKDNSKFIIEQINEFNHSIKEQYSTKNELCEAINAYKSVIEEYDLSIQPSEGLSKLVTNCLMSKY